MAGEKLCLGGFPPPVMHLQGTLDLSHAHLGTPPRGSGAPAWEQLQWQSPELGSGQHSPPVAVEASLAR